MRHGRNYLFRLVSFTKLVSLLSITVVSRKSITSSLVRRQREEKLENRKGQERDKKQRVLQPEREAVQPGIICSEESSTNAFG